MPMTRDEAIQLYLSRTTQPNQTIERLMRWDETKSAAENGKALGIPHGQAQTFKKKFGLKAKNVKPVSPLRRDVPKLKELLKLGYTYDQISRIYQCSRQNIERVVSTYGNGVAA